MTNPNMANREVCDLIFVDYATKKPFLNLDFANVSTTELTGESVFAYGGKGHPKRVQFSGERGGTLTIETQIQTVKLWQLITGGELNQSAKFVTRIETVVDDAGTEITLPDEPTAGSTVVYAANDDCGTELACTPDQYQIHKFSEELYRIWRYGHENGERRNPALPPRSGKMRASVQHELILLQQRRSRHNQHRLRPAGRSGRQYPRPYSHRRIIGGKVCPLHRPAQRKCAALRAHNGQGRYFSLPDDF